MHLNAALVFKIDYLTRGRCRQFDPKQGRFRSGVGKMGCIYPLRPVGLTQGRPLKYIHIIELPNPLKYVRHCKRQTSRLSYTT